MEHRKRVINYVSTNDVVGKSFISTHRNASRENCKGEVYTVIDRVYHEGRRSRLEGLDVAFGDGHQVFFSIEGCYRDPEVAPAQPPQITQILK